MANVFVVQDVNGKQIRLTRERWRYIMNKHPDIADPELLQEVITRPTAVRQSHDDESVRWMYRYDKEENMYVLVSVK